MTRIFVEVWASCSLAVCFEEKGRGRRMGGVVDHFAIQKRSIQGPQKNVPQITAVEPWLSLLKNYAKSLRGRSRQQYAHHNLCVASLLCNQTGFTTYINTFTRAGQSQATSSTVTSQRQETACPPWSHISPLPLTMEARVARRGSMSDLNANNRQHESRPVLYPQYKHVRQTPIR